MIALKGRTLVRQREPHDPMEIGAFPPNSKVRQIRHDQVGQVAHRTIYRTYVGLLSTPRTEAGVDPSSRVAQVSRNSSRAKEVGASCR